VEETVGRVVDGYLTEVDDALPGRIEGLYLVGSVALDDFRPGSSDIDFVAVSAERLGEDDLEALAGVHRRLGRRTPQPPLSGVYVTWADLPRDPRTLGPVPQHHEGRLSPEGGLDADVVQWLTLRTRPVAARGPEAPEVWTDEAGTRAWVLENLNTYWSEWAARQRSLARGITPIPDRVVAWGVLGIARLHYTLATGEVTSKTQAGAYARETFGERWHPIIAEAQRLRRGDGEQAPGYRRHPLTRRQDTLEFMAHVIEDANERFGPA
jgi:Domain of unknown function (DUF4111)/Nucleotidyltransferase domain